MGNCCIKSINLEYPDGSFYADLQYQNPVQLSLHGLYGSTINGLISDNTYKLPSPINQSVLNIQLGNLPINLSTCTIPGMDFRIDHVKVCQDTYTIIPQDDTLLIVLCDGHGSIGHTIAGFITDYIIKSFKKHFLDFRVNPKKVISRIVKKCDNKILNTMDCQLSGSTLVVAFIINGTIHCANVGDSRAIIGTLSHFPDAIPIRTSKYFRKTNCERTFKAANLSKDHKPELEDETLRIRKSGGTVQKYRDSFGRNVGPYRVWNSEGSGPGLAMSRSLGDKVGKDCGVISVPVFSERKIVPGKDQYIVIASDGVWDVLYNIEAINFIDKWHGKCFNISTNEYPANTNNCSIARLLCEEARYRWLGSAQTERVAIDDISCIVLDFSVEVVKDILVPGPNEEFLVSIDPEAESEFTEEFQ